jgi:hypothetical protein
MLDFDEINELSNRYGNIKREFMEQYKVEIKLLIYNPKYIKKNTSTENKILIGNKILSWEKSFVEISKYNPQNNNFILDLGVHDLEKVRENFINTILKFNMEDKNENNHNFIKIILNIFSLNINDILKGQLKDYIENFKKNGIYYK